MALSLHVHRFVDFAMHRVRMLIHFGVTPYIVFDGDYLPSKAITEIGRAEKRAESKRIGLELYRMGKPSQAHLELQKAVDVTPEMARQFIEELKRHGVEYIVAPYEADAQLVYLERKDIIQGILSEDSDMLVFGAKRLLTKLDQYGDCVEIHRDDFTACTEISLVGWSDAEFRRMAILSGCDYLANINKMGLKTAYRLVRKYKSIEKILRIIQFDGQYRVPAGYLENFQKAELTFLHQRVFCPHQNKLVMVTDLGAGLEPADLDFIGKDVDAEIAMGVAKGDLHPMTKNPITAPVQTPKISDRSWQDSRRKSMGTPIDGKPNQSIEAFFKSQRTPLAELDHNSFTPSPSQQRLLIAHQNASWSSSPAPSRPPLVQSNTSLSNSTRPTASAPPASRLEPALNSKSVLHPPKRQRLCDEDPADDGFLPSISGTSKSRFFATSAPEPSPMINRKGKNRSKAPTINIWSDDSIDEVMLGLPDVSVHAEKRTIKKLSIFKDDVDSKSEEPKKILSAVPDLLQSSNKIHGMNSVMSTILSRAASSTREFDTPASTIGVDTNVGRGPILEKFSYQPCPREESTACITRAVSKETATSAEKAVVKPRLVRHESMTGLQRLGEGALKRSQSQSDTQHPPHRSRDRRSRLECKADALLEAMRSHVPQSPDTPTMSATKGSEDLLVPNSEDDSSEEPSVGVKPAREPKLDLDRFAYEG